MTVKRRFCIFLIMSLVLPARLSASVSDTVKGGGNRSDTMYIRDYTNYLTMRAYFLIQEASLNLYHDQAGELIYRPHLPYRLGISGNYKWIGLGFSLGLPTTAGSNVKYGKTTSIDLRLNAYTKFGIIEASFQQYKGFYLKYEGIDGKEIYTLPDMNSFSLGLTGTFVYNFKRFSVRAAYIQNEKQLKSAGSFMFRCGIEYYDVNCDSSLIPPEIVYSLSLHTNKVITRVHAYNFQFAPGYGYTFVFLKDFYVCPAMFAGVNFSLTEFRAANGISQSRNIILYNLMGRMAAGYNNVKWYAGGSITLNVGQKTLADGPFQSNYFLDQIRFWVGSRFDLFRKKEKKL